MVAGYGGDHGVSPWEGLVEVDVPARNGPDIKWPRTSLRKSQEREGKL